MDAREEATLLYLNLPETWTGPQAWGSQVGQDGMCSLENEWMKPSLHAFTSQGSPNHSH